MYSEYLKRLLLKNRDVGERYKIKLRLIDDLDPFNLTISELNCSIDGVPPVTNMDIISYLVLTHSFYSKMQMKAFKSLEAYKYFESGFVMKVGTKIQNDKYILVGQVKHSQKANEKPSDVWCIIEKDGSICTAHCTCMAGNSEVCSHVGAILFAAEYTNTKREAMSCTDLEAMWPMPSLTKNVPIVPVHEMYWGTHSGQPQNKREIEIAPISEDELSDMLEQMSELGYNCPLMRIVEPFASRISAESIKTVDSVLNIFDISNVQKSYCELMMIAKTVDLSLTEAQIVCIEEATRKQSENQNWFLQRAGRITASKFKSVCKTNESKPSLSLIKSICYPTKILFNTKATLWGISNENNAVKQYEMIMVEENHECLQVNEVGLIINKKWPQLGASPDRLVYCECCLGGCLEVKCPYLLHVNNIQNIKDYLNMKSSCLVKQEGVISLDKKHSYYYQVQMQIFISQLRYCDFVIWSPNIFFKQRILPDLEFWEQGCESAIKFHSEVIMPELLGKYFTAKEGSAKITHYCICNGVDDGRTMIECDEDNCEIKWFHFECVGLVEFPEYAWYCSKCK